MTLPRRPGLARTLDVARISALVVAALVLVALQMGGLGRLRLFGVYPEMLVVVVCSVALLRGPFVGVVVGVIFGFAADLPGGHLVGLSAVGYAAAGLAAGLLGVKVFPERWIVVGSAVALGTAVSQIVYVAGARAFGFPLPFWEVGPQLVGAMVLYHLLLTPLLYPLTRGVLDMISPHGMDA